MYALDNVDNFLRPLILQVIYIVGGHSSVVFSEWCHPLYCSLFLSAVIWFIVYNAICVRELLYYKCK